MWSEERTHLTKYHCRKILSEFTILEVYNLDERDIQYEILIQIMSDKDLSDDDMDGNEESELQDEVQNFLRRNFPQIQMHGGSADILSIDEEEGEVDIHLGGACSGCGVSPMTTQAIKKRLPSQIDNIIKVTVSTGGGFDTPSVEASSEEKEDDKEDQDYDAPF